MLLWRLDLTVKKKSRFLIFGFQNVDFYAGISMRRDIGDFSVILRGGARGRKKLG